MILPELVAALVLLVLCGVVMVGIGIAQRVTESAVTGWFIRTWQQRARTRKQEARRTAHWESRTRYQRGFVLIDVIRVARWDDCEEIMEQDEPTILPEDEFERVAAAQLEADIRADQRNRQL